jgi:Acyclic terpene utilisation family protein AtuA
MKKPSCRIAAGQGFWGDRLDAPILQIQQGQIDYLILDYLAEVTMSVLVKQKQKNPDAGYAKDFVSLIKNVARDLAKKNITVIANAGGINPKACAEEVKKILRDLNLEMELPIAVVEGDDLLNQIDQLTTRGEHFVNLDNKKDFSEIRNKILSANAYLGADGIVEALALGAKIIITGRVADPSLTLGALIYNFNWGKNDFDKLASGTVAGHVIECGAQASGGNYSFDWHAIENFENIGFPIIEAYSDGSFIVTKHPNTGGRVDKHSVTEQLIYEIGDPKNYISPDCIVDFTTINLEDLGDNKVKISGVKGKKPTDFYKVSLSYHYGYTIQGTMLYSWPDAYAKATRAGEIIKNRIASLNLDISDLHLELIGVNSCHGILSEKDLGQEQLLNIPEVMLRVAARGQDKKSLERFSREIAPLVLCGPPSATGYAGGKQDVKEVAAYWPSLVKKEFVKVQVELV